MKITITNDFRGLKKDVIYDFTDLKQFNRICVAGENGCGKSSLFQALRGFKNDAKTSSLYESDFITLSKNINVEHDYEKIFYFDRVKDDGANMSVAYDASGYIEAGGFHTRDKSHGQSSLIYIDNFIRKISDKIIPEKSLIVLDEVDAGFSLKTQTKVIHLINNLIIKYKCDVIVITHNPFLISDSILVFDFANNTFDASERYLKNQTGFVITKLV